MPASVLMLPSSTFISLSGASTDATVNGAVAASSRAKIALARSSRSRSRVWSLSAVTAGGDVAVWSTAGGLALPGGRLLQQRGGLGVLVAPRESGRPPAGRQLRRVGR